LGLRGFLVFLEGRFRERLALVLEDGADDELDDDCGSVVEVGLFVVVFLRGGAGVILAISVGSTMVAFAIVILCTEYRLFWSVLDLNLNFRSNSFTPLVNVLKYYHTHN
jgi:hypothetical protein